MATMAPSPYLLPPIFWMVGNRFVRARRIGVADKEVTVEKKRGERERDEKEEDEEKGQKQSCATKERNRDRERM